MAFSKHKEEGIENLARYFEHGKMRIAESPHLDTIVRQLLRFHRNEQGKVVKKDDHGPDALMCAMLHFPFIDEFDTAISQLLSGTDRERLKVTNSMLDACVRDYPLEVPDGGRSSMGVSLGTSGLYVAVSLAPSRGAADQVRRALFIGRVREWAELDPLLDRYHVRTCLIAPHAEPHLVQAWAQAPHSATVYQVSYTNDGVSDARWDDDATRVTVDRTFALNAAFEEIRDRKWWLPPAAQEIENGEFYAQMKATTRVRDLASPELRYRWLETGRQDHFRHAHAFDLLAGRKAAAYVEPACVCGDGYDDLLADYTLSMGTYDRGERLRRFFRGGT